MLTLVRGRRMMQLYRAATELQQSCNRAETELQQNMLTLLGERRMRSPLTFLIE